MWLFDIPKNYSNMIEKVSKCVFFVSLLGLFILTGVSSSFAGFMKKCSFGVEYELFGIKLYMALLYIPLIISVLENAIQLHDIFQKPLKIRETFDRKIIIAAFLNKLEIEYTNQTLKGKKIYNAVMYDVFYKYASSTNPKIDAHVIELALGTWCWFWIVFDTEILFLVLGFMFVILNGSRQTIGLYVIGNLALVGLMLLLIFRAAVRSRSEVNAILKTDEYEKIKETITSAL